MGLATSLRIQQVAQVSEDRGCLPQAGQEAGRPISTQAQARPPPHPVAPPSGFLGESSR